MTRRIAVCAIIVLALLRLCHIHLLWADEDYHLAAAINILHGKIPYRDFWYDKPPFAALFYLLIAGYPGWPLRVLDAGYVLVACYVTFRLSKALWGIAEGYLAALLLAFFLAFYLPSAVIPFAADALMIVPHLAAIYFAQQRSPLWSGCFAGIAFLANPKAVFVLAACVVWLPAQSLTVIAGFTEPLVFAFWIAIWSGAWSGYVEQVWRWGWIYAQGSPVSNPFRTGLVRTLDWAGFHAAPVSAAAFAFTRFSRSQKTKFGSWILLSFFAVALGTRFAPHYFLQLLPPVVIAASRGIALAWDRYGRRAAVVFAVLALVPFVRFGPRYAALALDNLRGLPPQWSDVAMDLDSQAAASKIRGLSRASDTLFVWGYRPDIYVYTRLVSDSRFWDSQPLTGVPADRHLSATTPIYSAPAQKNREQLVQSHPTFLVDGLGLLNPKLQPSVYPELRPWLAHYKLVARTKLCLIYRLDHAENK